MSRIQRTFQWLSENNEKGLIPFITAGHPHPLLTVPIMHSLVKNGANIIELGMPFSDPMADGIVIQNSSEKALRNGMNLSLVLDIVSEFRETDIKTPVVLMGYLNPIERFGYKNFVKQASAVGVDGILIVDSPPEESDDLLELLHQYKLHQIFLIAPTTEKKRQEYILSKSGGFIYCVALKGVTGASQSDSGNLQEQIAVIRSLNDIPVAVGFGVKDAESAISVSQYCDAVVIGSALVEKLDQCNNQQEAEEMIESFIKPVYQALNVNK